MWRRSGDGEVYAYMPNEQVIQIIDNKALKWCDFDHDMIKIIDQIMKMKLMALTMIRCDDNLAHFFSGWGFLRGAWRPLQLWVWSLPGQRSLEVIVITMLSALLVLVAWKFDTCSKTPDISQLNLVKSWKLVFCLTLLVGLRWALTNVSVRRCNFCFLLFLECSQRSLDLRWLWTLLEQWTEVWSWCWMVSRCTGRKQDHCPCVHVYQLYFHVKFRCNFHLWQAGTVEYPKLCRG